MDRTNGYSVLLFIFFSITQEEEKPILPIIETMQFNSHAKAVCEKVFTRHNEYKKDGLLF